jgi:hypothetical protein
MGKCYDYFKCEKDDCPASGSKAGLECWEIENTHCSSTYLELLRKHKKDICKYCLYYKMVHSSDPKYWNLGRMSVSNFINFNT